MKPFIHVKGAREHNLRNIEVMLPRDKLTVITGVSGSGKSSLAFETIYAEGYRKYIESLSSQARYLLEQVKRPDVDFVHGLSPVIAIEQRGGGMHNPRSTVATVSEIADYSRLLWSVGAKPVCPKDGGKIVQRTLDDCIARILSEKEGSRFYLMAHSMDGKNSVLRGELPRLLQRGFQRVRVNGEIKRLDEATVLSAGGESSVDIVIDRLTVDPAQRSRLADSLELTFKEGRNQAIILFEEEDGSLRELMLSQHFSCEHCGTVYDKFTPKHFSYNHVDGCCSTCKGLGYTLQFEEKFVVPNPKLSVTKGAIKPWRLGSKQMIIRRNAILKQLAEQLPFDLTVAWEALDEHVRQVILHGAGDRIFRFKFGRKAGESMPFEGVLADLRHTFAHSSSEGLRAKLVAYQTSQLCPHCLGERLSDYARAAKFAGVSFPAFMQMPISDAAVLISDYALGLSEEEREQKMFGEIIFGLKGRLEFLKEVGLGYLSLDRPYYTLSGGEAQRVRLATQLGMGLVGVTYVLDEPSIGLHPADNSKLVATLQHLRDQGNTVVVVEHDEEMIVSADHLIELGPGAGNEGGALIMSGSMKECLKNKASLTVPFLNGTRFIEKNGRTLPATRGSVSVRGAAEHNLKNIDVDFPVGLLTVVCGVSGSGKSTLVNDILAAEALRTLNRAKTIAGKHAGILGLEQFDTVVLVDQEPIGKSPRSNPATYTKLFDLIRDLFAQCSLAKIRGYAAKRFSFNLSGGRCERCQGDGSIKVDMQFLSDVYVDCPSCAGQRFNRETLEVRYKGLNIAEVLSMTIDEAAGFFKAHPSMMLVLKTLQDVGLGYLQLGQASNTLSGGESQRLKLAMGLSRKSRGQSLYILDEPTTGLHWLDIQKLMDTLFRLRDAGNTVIVIEHNLDVVDLADYLVEVGPHGGRMGGQLIFSGERKAFDGNVQTPTAVALAKKRDRRQGTVA